VVEVISGLLTLIWWFMYGLTPQGAALLVLSYALIAITFIDLEHRIIPNRITLPLIVGGLAFRLFQGELVSAIIGGLAGGGILLIIALLYPGGMGYGDVKLLAVSGVFLGWQKALLILFVGSALGVIIMTPLLILKKIDRKTPFPFGPFLAAASLIAIFWWEGAQWLLYWKTGL
jgi:leader peptidase (prepilin peptidase)/N-methyltransferase